MKSAALGMGFALLMAAGPAGAEMRRPGLLPLINPAVLAPSQPDARMLTQVQGKAPNALVRVQSEQATSAAAAIEIVGTSTDVLVLRPDQVDVWPIPGEGAGFGLALRMSKDSARDFARMTEAYVGQVLEVYLCGELATSAVVMGPISSGTVSLFGDLPQDSAIGLARRIKTGDCAGFTVQEMESLDGS